MTFDELRERIKEEIVLHEGDLAEWEWQRKGLLTEAAQLGLSSADFFRLVNQISHAVLPDFGRISELKIKILDRARQTRKQLPDADVRQFTEEADRLQLSRQFLTERWIPALMAGLPDETPPPLPTPEPTSAPPPKESLQPRIQRILSRYDKHITAHQLEVLFDAIEYDSEALAEEILAYLSAHYFAAVTSPTGNTLREKLLSTDWRHLSWWEEKATPTPVQAAPAPPVPPTLDEAPFAPEPKRSGLSDSAVVGLAIAAVVVMLVATVWVIQREPDTPKSTEKGVKSSVPQSDTEASAEKPRGSESTGRKKRKKNSARNESSGSAEDGVYDEVGEAGEFGLRPARRGRRWGFVDENDRWKIAPRYESVTVFDDRRAQVVLNGQPFYIDRFGNRIIRE